LIFPVSLGFLTGYLINYLSDVLPDSLHLGIPECQNQSCRKPYSWRDYLFLRSCRKCGQRRKLRTFLVLPLAIAAALYLWFNPPVRLGFAFGMLLLTYLFLIAVIDLEHRLVLRPLSIIGLSLSTLAGFLLHSWQSTVIGGLFGFCVIFIIYLLGTRVTHWIAKKQNQKPGETEETFGSGDVALAAIQGLLLGWPLIWFGLLLGFLILGLVVIPLLCVLLIKRHFQRHVLVYIPIGVPFILSTILLVYLSPWILALLPK
jgi:hypothetical protein